MGYYNCKSLAVHLYYKPLCHTAFLLFMAVQTKAYHYNFALKACYLAIFTFFASLACAQTNQTLRLDEYANANIKAEVKANYAVQDQGRYLSKAWNKGKVHLISGQSLDDFLLKFNVQHNQLELKNGQYIKVCDQRLFTAFEWADTNTGQMHRFVRVNNFKFKSRTLYDGVFEVLVEGPVQLLWLVDLKKESGQVRPYPSGSFEASAYNNHGFYMAINGMAYPIENSRKKNLAHLGQVAPTVKEYMRVNRLQFNNVQNLIHIMVYTNTIISEEATYTE